jgi:ABC-type transport system involved in cytochrome c biogenesis permease subunit
VYWFTDRLSFAAAVVLYGASALYTIFLWRQGFRRDSRVNYFLIAAGFLFHTWAMVARGFSLSSCPINNLYEATIFIAWTMVVAYLGLATWSRLHYLGAFVSPLLLAIGVFALMPALDIRGPKPEFTGALRSLHGALILLAYGAFGLSGVAGVMFLTQDHNLKFNKIRAVACLMPSIQRLERVMGILLTTAFVLLTWGLLVGSVWLKRTRGVYYAPDPMIHWSVLVWIFYLVLQVVHWVRAQPGRRFAWGVIVGFAFIMLTFWGFYLLSPVHHR